MLSGIRFLNWPALPGALFREECRPSGDTQDNPLKESLLKNFNSPESLASGGFSIEMITSSGLGTIVYFTMFLRRDEKEALLIQR
jgi:hypothetical protein